LIGAILQGRQHTAVALDRSSGQRSGFYDLACVLAWLASLGYSPRLSTWDPPLPGRLTPGETKKPGLSVSLCGANFVKPKPVRPPVPVAARQLPAAKETRTAPPLASLLSPELTDSPMIEMNQSANGEAAAGTAKTPGPLALAHPRAATDAPALTQALHLTRESLASLLKVQEQTAHLHRQFLESQEQAQRTLHLLVEQQQRLLQAALGLAPVAPVSAIAEAAPSPAVLAPPPVPTPVVAPTPPPIASTPSPISVVRGAPHSRIEGVLREVVAEKTGYPPEMLELDLALDADLGIDSIKRVEILSALQERLPEAPAVKPEHLGALHTLRHIADFLAGNAASAVAGQEIPRAPAWQSADSSDPHKAISAENSQRVLLEVVAEKTGYPPEMLELDLALDADLGIDSIKRVEILSALQERLPEAPAVKPEHLGALHTLRHLADFLAGRVQPVNGATPPSRELIPPTPTTATSRLERCVLQAVPLAAPASRETIGLTPGVELWIAADEEDLAQCLLGRLRQLGFLPRWLPCAAVRDQAPPEVLGALILIAPVRGVHDHFLSDALFGLQRAAPALRQAGRQGKAIFLTVARLDGHFGLTGLDLTRAPIDGGLAGLAKTVSHEWPEVSARAIDLAADFPDLDAAAAALLDEALLSGPMEVGITNAGRVTLEMVRRPLPEGPEMTPFQPAEVVVVSGGARGVTAEVAAALARAWQPTLVLLGRSPLSEREPDWLIPLASEAEIKRELGLRANGTASPRLIGEQARQVTAQREIRQTLARIEAAGARVLYRTADVRDPAAVAAVLGPLRDELGPVRGLIHGAGVLADAHIEQKTPEQFERVIATKVGGLRALLQGLNPEELRVLVLFSSITGRLGRKGQIDYAVANEVLNKLAQHHARRWPSCRVVSVSWGPWDGGMVTPSLKKLFAAEGVDLIPPEEGANYLIKEISQADDRTVEVVVRAPSAPLSGPGTSPTIVPGGLPVAFERTLDLASHPILGAHLLDGRPVLPLALTLEWLAHAALHHNPGLAFHGCNNLHVLHGVILDEQPPTVRVAAGQVVRAGNLFVTPVELRGLRQGREVIHVRADAVLAADLPPAPTPQQLPEVRPYNHSIDQVYAELLFHGPELQGIERIDGCGERGILARVRSAPAPTQWLSNALRQRWIADPLVLDAGFQLLILWALAQTHNPALPCRALRYRQYRKTFPADGVGVVVQVTRANELHALADIDFLDGAGTVVARMEGCECAIDPGLRRAFCRPAMVKQ
jgi:NAD(P)-dependent dehydrogenase (short-subunit alcohol dehydrogenase family)/acyl carrier protein